MKILIKYICNQIYIFNYHVYLIINNFRFFICSFYWPLFLIFGLILPLNAPLEYWNESLIETILITGFLRFAITINISWLINSALLIWNIKEGEKLMHISDTISLLYKLFFKMPRSHDTVVINNSGVHIK